MFNNWVMQKMTRFSMGIHFGMISTLEDLDFADNLMLLSPYTSTSKTIPADCKPRWTAGGT